MQARFALVVVAGLLAIPLAWLQAEDRADLAKASLPPGLVAPETRATAAAGICFLEGPAVDAQGNVFFSDIIGNQILKSTPDGKVAVFRADSGRTNGNTF